MLNKNDFKSIWEIAHLWEEIDPPPDIDPSKLSDGVSDKIQKLIWAFRREQITLRHLNGHLASHVNQGFLDVLIFDRTQLRLNSCLKKKHFPRSLLYQLFVLRSELLNWCDKDRIEPPAFWDQREQKSLNAPEPQGTPLFGRHLTEEIDKNRCQAIALTLWGLDPSIHPAHLAKSKAMRVFGNGGNYKRKNGEFTTVNEWIKELDPNRETRKPGNPGKVNYLIDLETHRLKQD